MTVPFWFLIFDIEDRVLGEEKGGEIGCDFGAVIVFVGDVYPRCFAVESEGGDVKCYVVARVVGNCDTAVLSVCCGEGVHIVALNTTFRLILERVELTEIVERVIRLEG